jgi:hypothetical protein
MVPVDGDTRPAPLVRRIVISTADWRRASHPAISQTRMFERRLHALVAGMVLLGTAIVVTVVVALDRTGSALQALDDRWLAWMTEIRTPLLTRIARILSVVGGPLVMVPLRLTVIGALAWRRRWLQVGAFVGATVARDHPVRSSRPTRRRSRRATPSPRRSRRSGWWSCWCRRPTAAPGGQSSRLSSPR